MNISLKLRATKKHSQLMLRLYYKHLDISCLLDVFVQESEWNSTNQLVKNNKKLNEKLLELKSAVLNRYNVDYVQGVVISKAWLKNVVSDVFNRPSQEVGLVSKEQFIYLSDYATYWIKEKSSSWKVSAKKFMSKNLISQYEISVKLLKQFERQNGSKIQMKDLSVNDFYEFINFLEEQDYNSSTIERIIGRIRFFCNRSLEEGIKITQTFKQRIYIDKEDETDGVFLTEEEVIKIYETDFTFDQKLQTAKENLLIGIHTGLRFGDYVTNLDLSNIKDDFITITTQKTKTKIVVPVHPIVKEIISSNFGNLPAKMSAYEFGKAIKTLGQICGFDELVYGSKWNPIKKRKEKGYFKRYELFTSHICRRSMATNLYGKIPNDSIMAILGWKSTEMLMKYVKTTKKQQAEKLKQYWDK